jgi:hypothetical protein
MRVHRSIQILTILTTITACSSPGEAATAQPAAAEPAPPAAAEPAPSASPTIAVNLRWDSAPLDRAYHSERADLDARHARETARPGADESAKVRVQRQENENQALERRYTRGKDSHARSLPPAER